jgi:ABC-type Zn2+ transport system substrate-binding protein/surface adhesin
LTDRLNGCQHPSIEEGIAKALDNIDTQRKLYVVEKSTQPLNEKHKEHRHHEEHKAHEEHRYHGVHKDYHIWLTPILGCTEISKSA